jgi:anti-sigma B factor antagonist
VRDITKLYEFKESALDVSNVKLAGVLMLRLENQILEFQGYKILIPSGEIDLYTAPQFKQSLISILDETEQHLILDMHNVRFMDSTGISTLMSAVKRINSNGGTVNLVGTKPNIDRILCTTNISAFIASHQNIEDAIEAISSVVSCDSGSDRCDVVTENHLSKDTLDTAHI